LGKYLCRSQQVRLYVMVEGKLKGIYIWSQRRSVIDSQDWTFFAR
jgi:hypothetical protein